MSTTPSLELAEATIERVGGVRIYIFEVQNGLIGHLEDAPTDAPNGWYWAVAEDGTDKMVGPFDSYDEAGHDAVDGREEAALVMVLARPQ